MEGPRAQVGHANLPQLGSTYDYQLALTNAVIAVTMARDKGVSSGLFSVIVAR